MNKEKSIITISVPTEVKRMLEDLAKATYSTNTKCIVDMIRKDHAYWFNKKEEEKVNESIKSKE